MEALTCNGWKRILVENGLCLKMDFNMKVWKTLFRGSVGYSSSIGEFPIKCVDSKGITCEKQVFYCFDFFFVIGVHMISFSKTCFIGYLCFVLVSIMILLIFELLLYWSHIVTVEQFPHITISSWTLTMLLRFGHLHCTSKFGSSTNVNFPSNSTMINFVS